MNKYEADRVEMFRAADLSMMCEKHPGREWPHDDCPGPGTPWILDGRTLIEEVIAREAPGHAALLQGALAQLRHAYQQLTHHDERWSRRGMKGFADGLLAPQIRKLEQLEKALTLHGASPTQE